MENRLWEKDGLSRDAYTDRGTKGQRVEVLESDASALLMRVLRMGKNIPYTDGNGVSSGTWREMWWWEPLVVLTEIKMLDLCGLGKTFAKPDQVLLEQTTDHLIDKVKGWQERLGWSVGESFANDICTMLQPRQAEKQAWSYELLEGLRRMQDNYTKYLDEIEKKGCVDPSLALLVVFIRNYGMIARRFNDRWKDLERFYLSEVLHVRPREIKPDRLWLSLEKAINVEGVFVKKGTGFIPVFQEAGKMLCYRTVEDSVIGLIKPERMISLFLECDPEWQPAADMGFTTAVWRKNFDLAGGDTGKQLFGGEDADFVSVGLVVESPMLLLGDGERTVTLSFYLTDESVRCIEGVKEKCGGYRWLNDAFYLEITTETGWVRIVDYVLNFREGTCLEITFRLFEEFPAVCCGDMQKEMLRMPALRILLNKDAWLFPYSWAKQMVFYKMKIGVRVAESRNMKIYTELGELDANMSLAPFGFQPEQGAWMVLGSYEMAQKPVVSAGFKCRWVGLPRHAGGLGAYYKAYGGNIGNDSFRVRAEWLEDGKWEGRRDESQVLFTTGNHETVGESSYICWKPDKKMPVVTVTEQGYEFGRLKNGFMRMMLVGPEMGFGHKLYRRLFAETMMYNSRHKKQLLVPAEPLSLQADELSLDYEAEEEFFLRSGQFSKTTRLYHIQPLANSHLMPVKMYEPVPFVEGPDSRFTLLLGFSGASGYNRLRFLMDFAPFLGETLIKPSADVQHDLDCTISTVSQGEWSVLQDGHWNILPAVAVLRDDTECFMRGGLIEIELPNVVTEQVTGKGRLLWIKAEFSGVMNCFASVRGVYANVVEVAGEDGGRMGGIPLGTGWRPEKALPGIDAVIQASAGHGGRSAEQEEGMALRLADRIAGRGRLVTAADYERAVMERFPLIAKVKCLPAADAKELGRKSIVTIVVMQKQEDGSLPMCTNDVLLEIEDELKHLVSRFVTVDAVNPVYEEMTVRCRISLMPGSVAGVVIKRLEDKLNGYIAPWLQAGEMPRFGYRFSLQALRNTILEDAGVARLWGVAVLHVTPLGERVYRLNEYAPELEGEMMVKASAPWCVAVPSERHLVELAGDWQQEVGIGELEIGKTMIIGSAGEE